MFCAIVLRICKDSLDSWKQVESFENWLDLWSRYKTNLFKSGFVIHDTNQIFLSPDLWPSNQYESMDLQNKSMFLRISYTIPASLKFLLFYFNHSTCKFETKLNYDLKKALKLWLKQSISKNSPINSLLFISVSFLGIPVISNFQSPRKMKAWLEVKLLVWNKRKCFKLSYFDFFVLISDLNDLKCLLCILVTHILLIGPNGQTSDVSLDPIVSPTILYPAIQNLNTFLAFLDDSFQVRIFIQ